MLAGRGLGAGCAGCGLRWVWAVLGVACGWGGWAGERGGARVAACHAHKHAHAHAQDVAPGSTILCADGSISLEVLSTNPAAGTVRVKCLNSATLG